MRYFSYNSTTFLGLAFSATYLLFNTSMAIAQDPGLFYYTNGATCQPVHTSKAQASYSTTGIVANKDENNTLKVVCPLHWERTGKRYKLGSVSIGTKDQHPTKNLRCRVGQRNNNSISQKTFYKSSDGMGSFDIYFLKSELDSLIVNNSAAFYLYCEIPEKSFNGSSYISTIIWQRTDYN